MGCGVAGARTGALTTLVLSQLLHVFECKSEQKNISTVPYLNNGKLVLAVLAAAGRILFGPIPDFKPVSAIAIIAGATLGRRNGFMVGALAALTSNFFFGQGMWTPWQMYAWGLVGYVGGALTYAGAFDRADGTVRMPALLAYGFASGLLYGVVINAYDIIGFVQPLTWAGAVARLATAVPFDITHGLATCVFLVALYKPWCRRINRVVVKYGL